MRHFEGLVKVDTYAVIFKNCSDFRKEEKAIN